MTPSLIRGRPRRAKGQISVRLLIAVVGVLVATVWLLLPGPSSAPEPGVAAGAAAQEETEETSTGDLVLPLVAAVAAVAVAGYTYVRRTRRTRTRTTPGGAPAPDASPGPADLDERSQALLVEADNWVRVSREELTFVPSPDESAERALREAERELASAFRMRQRYDDGVPEDDAGRRQVLAGIIGRCEEAGRRLDTEAAGFDQLRGLEADLAGALGAAEARFRELTSRTGAAGTTLTELTKRYGTAATAPVAGYVEQAKDRLVFATSRLNEAHQSADRDETDPAIGQLRAAETAVAQAETLVDAVERLAEELPAAAALVPPALTGAETEIAGARERATGTPGGPADVRLAHADGVLSDVREELLAGPYDPIEALRRIVRGVVPVADGRAGVLRTAAWLVARASTAAAESHVATHRGTVGSAARTRLAESRRLLATGPGLTDLLTADALSRRARDLAEQDIRLGGAAPEPSVPLSFGGPRTCGRRG
ncbi:hypothetical protein [Streptomyces sp. G1]|uniref:hypothetical protein n=1 Tax=Streptomyces sp. G1 TaxID=361572 RepID=UPI0027E537C4|nr:hypothetical protein [Streptomyces sp. G1]